MEKRSLVQNRKGQDLSIGTLILIVLGIVVLVLLILGFSMGWENLWEKINIFGGGSSISAVATACDLAAQQDNKFAYCQEFKEVTVGQDNEYLSCEDQRIQPSLDNKLSCESSREQVNERKMELCEGFTPSDRRNTEINGEKCHELFPDTYNSEGEVVKECSQYKDGDKTAAPETAATCPEGKKEVPESKIKGMPERQICCIDE